MDGKKVKSHPHLLRDTECTGPMRARSLAHRYETDLLDLAFDRLALLPGMDVTTWCSLLYALLEGAAERLQISRDDIDGTLRRRPGGQIGLVMFDTVPGGAGGVLRIAGALDQVVEAALGRVSGCDCGEALPAKGLTNVAFPLRFAARELARVPARDARVVLLSDCVHNAGPDPRPLAARLSRLDVLLDVTGEHDLDLGRDLARAGRGRLYRIRHHRDVAPALSRVFAD